VELSRPAYLIDINKYIGFLKNKNVQTRGLTAGISHVWRNKDTLKAEQQPLPRQLKYGSYRFTYQFPEL